MPYYRYLGNVPPKRKHTLAESRPWQMHLGWGLLLAYWIGTLVLAGWSIAHDTANPNNSSPTTIFWVSFWGLAVVAFIVRGWWGGPYAWVCLRQLARVLGALFIVGMIAFVVLGFTYHVDASLLVYLLPGLSSGAALLGAGFLLSARPVRTWYAGT